MKKTIFTIVGLSLLTFGAFAQKKDRGTSFDSIRAEVKNKYLNWQNLDPEKDNVMGVSTERAYSELLKGKKPKKEIIVAVIDGGVDIKHEDFKGHIWVNEDEIPNNGIDDDNNGYIDDVNGWNFIGNEKGENMTYSHLEKTRIVRKYHDKFKNVKSEKELSTKDVNIYKEYKRALKSYEKSVKEAKIWEKLLTHNENKTIKAQKTLAKYLTPSDTLCKKELLAIKPQNRAEKKAKNRLLELYSVYVRNTKEYYEKAKKVYYANDLDYYLNVNFDARKLIGDDDYNFNDRKYGNNKVDGDNYGSGHGTFVSGVIAANRNNGIGINGIAENVKIMAIRVVPDGDEYDKDVALAIKYAIDNGAQVINMSFGKYFCVNKYMVDEVLNYAKDKNVLLFHAAGNESLDNDKNVHYPIRKFDNGEVIPNWIAVGASTKYMDKRLPAIFSNYGQTDVEFFSPGRSIFSTYPQNTYRVASGTSFACPIAAGVAALVWSYYPNLTAVQLKDILMKSVIKYDGRVTRPKDGGLFHPKTKFSKLSVTGGVVNAYKALQEAEKM